MTVRIDPAPFCGACGHQVAIAGRCRWCGCRANHAISLTRPRFHRPPPSVTRGRVNPFHLAATLALVPVLADWVQGTINGWTAGWIATAAGLAAIGTLTGGNQ